MRRLRVLVGAAPLLLLPWPSALDAQTANHIVPDGRTQTQLSVSGTTTNITTSTISGSTGFNSFSQFQEGAGNTVNLQVPNGANSLVNIVRNSPVVINGILNAYQDGKIGGNVYFADPYGFVVGAKGVVNVGGLTVTTPTREFLDTVVDSSGNISAAAARALMNGTAPISSDGMISIAGRINAGPGGVKLIGQSVVIAGPTSDVAFATRNHQRMFDASVNTRGLRTGAAIVSRGGSLQIVAAGDVKVAGRLSAVASRKTGAGTITITSGKDITIAATAQITAAGYKGKKKSLVPTDGGTITVKADGNLTVADGAGFNASAGLTGNGGFIDLSAKGTATIGNLTLNLSAPGGTTGTLLLDPYNLVVGDPSNPGTGSVLTSDSTYSYSGNLYTNGANVVLSADNSITITSAGVIDTRMFDHSSALSSTNASTGSSGSITLNAPNITVAGQLLANVVNVNGSSWTAGNITLNATSSSSVIYGSASATSTISITGTLNGGVISAITNATANASMLSSAAGYATTVINSLVATQIGLNGSYESSTAVSTVNVGSTAHITGSGSVTLSAIGNESSIAEVFVLTGTSPTGAAAGVGVGDLSATVSTTIASGANISAGGDLNIASKNTANMQITVISVSTQQTPVDATVAYSHTRINTDTIVHTGAVLSADGNVSVLAHNDNSFSTSATSAAGGAGVAGIAVAYSDTVAEASALLGASLGTADNKVSSLTVEASSDNDVGSTPKNATSATTITGNNFLLNAAFTVLPTSVCCGGNSWASSLINGPLNPVLGSAAMPKFGSAISYASSSISATAAIAADAGQAAPSIYAQSAVAVLAHVSDSAIRSNADASINSSANPNPSDPAGTISIAAGIAIGEFSHNTNAYIGSGVSVNAESIGVAAVTDIPIVNAWTNWDSLGAVMTHLNGNLGVVNDILTSYANATTESTQLGLAGAVNYFTITNSTTAWVGTNASLTQGLASSTWTTTTLSDGYVVTWNAPVSVQALTNVQSIDVAGNFGALSLSGSAGGTGSAVGGSLNMNNFSTTTTAGIAQGAQVTSDQAVHVDATTNDLFFAIAPSSGSAVGTLALSGIVSLDDIRNKTYASISNLATITAPDVTVNASQGVSTLSIAGAVVAGGTAAIGIGVAMIDAETDTVAHIGSNTADIANSGNAADDTGTPTATSGQISATNVSVLSETSGRLTVAAIAGTVADPNGSGSNFRSKLTGMFSSAPDTQVGAVSSVTRSRAGAISGGPAPTFSIDISGSSSVSIVSLATRSEVDGANITCTNCGTVNGQQVNGGLTVQALNNTELNNGSGSAALNLNSNALPGSSAIAGAIAVGILSDATTAKVDSSTITDARYVNVQALATGSETVVGIGLSASKSANSGAASISVSIGIVTDSVTAAVSDSSITGNSVGDSRNAAVEAYQSTDIGIGAGSLYLGGKGGLGISVTYAEIGNPSSGPAVNASIYNTSMSNFDSLDVVALDASRIGSGAAAGGGGPDSNGLAGAIVVNDISTATTASIGGVAGSILTINIGGNITVSADSQSNMTFNSILAALDPRSSSEHAADTQIDFTASDLNGGTANTPGASVVAVAGLVQAGKNNVGLSLVDNNISLSHTATVDNTHLISTGDVAVTANDSSTILGVTVGFGLATGQFAGLASTTLAGIHNTVLAEVGHDAESGVSASTPNTIISGASLTVAASDTSEIRSAAGALGISFGTAAIGLSVTQSDIGNNVTASINGGEGVRVSTSSADVFVNAAETGNILAYALGIAVSKNVGLAGSVAYSTDDTSVTAGITGTSDVTSHNNVAVVATNSDAIMVIAGAAGVTIGGPGAGVGLSIVNNTIGGDTIAEIGAGATVDALANGAGRVVNTGTLTTPLDLASANSATVTPPSLTETTKTVAGIAVNATSEQTILTNAVTLGLAFSPTGGGFAVVPVTNVMGGTTQASITGALIDTRLTGTTAPVVDVTASSASYAGNYIIAGALGAVAGAGANAGTTMDRQTLAYITTSTVGTTNPSYTGPGVAGVNVYAAATEGAADVVIGFAAGVGGGAASGVVNSFSAVTEAYVDQGVLTAQSLTVAANSLNGFYAAAGAGAGGGVGLASAYVVGTSNNTTLASVGDTTNATTLNLDGALSVTATSNNTFTTLAAGGAAAGGLGVAGMVNIMTVTNDTTAGLYGVSLTTAAGAGSGGTVTVNANETVTIDPTTGAGALALGGAGLGSGTNVVQLGSQITAEVVGSTLNVPGAVSITATGTKTVDSETLTIGAGSSLGVGAAVGVIMLGSTASSAAMGQLDANGSGTLSSVNQLTSGSDPVLSSAGLAAFRATLVNGATMTDAQVQAAANTAYEYLVQHGTVSRSAMTLSSDGLTHFAASALSSASLTDFTALTNTANATLSNGVITLTTAGLTALRSEAATALGIGSPTDAQVQAWANTRYQTLSQTINTYAYGQYAAILSDSITFTLNTAGITALRPQASTALNNAAPTDQQVLSYANDQFQALTNPTYVTLTNGVLTLTTAGVAEFQAAANASLGGATATASQVADYANTQYQFLVAHESTAQAPAAFSVSASLSKANDGVTASVAGGSVTAASLAVSSIANVSTLNNATGVGVSGSVGVGAAVAETSVYDAVTANVSQGTVHAGTVTVTATMQDGSANPSARVVATAGAGALAAAVGAAVADASVNNTVTAALGGTLVLTGAGTATSSDTSSLRSDAFGATVAGGLALGVSTASATKTSVVASDFLAQSSFTGTGLTLTSSGAGSSYAGAVAGVGGLLAAGDGAATNASDTTHVTSEVGAGVTINVGTGTLSVAATDTPDVKAFSLGVAVAGGLAVGVSIADATAAPTVLATLDGASSATDTITSGTLQLTATGAINGSPSSSIPIGVSTPSSTSDFTVGGTNAAALAIAGSGAVYYAGSGTTANATNNGNITASVGNYVTLPSGTVTISAINNDAQVASGTGVTVGGLAVGVVQTNATANVNTTASLGNYVTMLTAGTGSFTLSATGTDNDVAKSVAGSGGVYAGSGATANTNDTAVTTASIGDSSHINVNLVTISAAHTDNFQASIDSTQAAAVGASAAIAESDANSTVNVQIGSNVTIVAAGTGTQNCYTTQCLEAIVITATNTFNETGASPTITAGAGGGINGAGAVSTIGLTGNANITLGDNTTLSGGTDPINSPGTMSLVASTHLNVADTVSLVTGGAIQGAGVNSSLNSTLNNTVTTGLGDLLVSNGSIGIGTYTIAAATNYALVSTYGLAAVGVTDATTNITTNQTVTINSGTVILAYSNVNVTAGREPFGVYDTQITVNGADAEGYVRGLIAVPVADASANLINNATLNVLGAGSGQPAAAIESGQNVIMGAYDGTLNPNADGTGHGYELGFIPVTDGSSNPYSLATSTVNMNGNVTAGIYHNLSIVIGCGSDGTTMCGLNDRPGVFQGPDGIPVNYSYTANFNPSGYINLNFGTGTDTATALLNGTSSGTVQAIVITTTLYAAGGTVSINADHINGTGNVTSNGGPVISVVNNSAAYLIIAGGANIPDTPGGQILFTGAAIGSNTLQQHINNAGGLPSITLNNAYTGDGPGGVGPALFVGAPMTNLGGLLSIINQTGSYGASNADVNVQQLNVYVPLGAFAVGGDSTGIFNADISPISQWQSYITFPGGNPTTTTTLDVTNAVMYAANAYVQSQLGGATDQSSLNYALYHHSGDVQPNNLSYIFLGNCMAQIAGSCSGNYGFGGTDGYPTISYFALTTSVATAPTLTVTTPHIYGGQIAITANIININGTITSGVQTNQSIVLPVNLTSQFASDRSSYLTAIQSNANANSLYAITGVTVANSGDQQITASYDAKNQVIVLDKVNASSGAGYIVLDGQIISTTTLGSIHVNGGFGQVTVDNQTGVALSTQSINTGNAAAASGIVSTVKIVDRLANETTSYVYSPVNGLRVYVTDIGAQITSSTPYLQLAGNSTTYSPVAGARYEWALQADMTRNFTDFTSFFSGTGPNWVFSGNQNNPWSYVQAAYLSSLPYGYELPTSSTPQGTVIVDRSNTSAFSSTIQGGANLQWLGWGHYHGCDSASAGDCHYGFTQTGCCDSNGSSYADWYYYYATSAWLRLVNSAKADYPFAISFSGNANAYVNISSNAAVNVGANITNPNGSTSITTTSGGITQTNGATILTTNLNLNSAGVIGASGTPLLATMTNGGVLNAQSTGAINLSFNSAVAIGQVAAGSAGAYSDVTIVASSDITRASGLASNIVNVTGDNITLTSTNGSVGTVAIPLVISANSTTQNGEITGGVVNVSAHTDIGLTQATGDLLVGAIVSTAGNVLINVPNGSIYDASGLTSSQTLTSDQIKYISDTLHLIGTDAQNTALAGVAVFEANVKATFGPYTNLVQNGTVNSTTGVFTLNANALAIYRPFATASLGHAASDAEVQAYVNTQYQNDAALFARAYGANWATLPQFSGDYATYRTLLNNGAVTGGSFALSDSGVATYAGSVLTGSAATAFTALLANGSVAAGKYVLTNFGAYASAALGSNATAYTTLLGYGTVSGSNLLLSDHGVTSLATSALGSSDLAKFNGLLADGAVQNGVLTLSTSGLAAYVTQAGLSTTLTSAQVNQIANAQYQALAQSIQTWASGQYQGYNATIQTYANTQYQGYATTIQAYGSSRYLTFSTEFDYSASNTPGLVASLTANAAWTANQIISAVDQAALAPASPVVGNGKPNIVGHDLTLNASGGIGQLAPSVSITITDLQSGNLTDAQRAALAAATTAGSVTVYGNDAQGHEVVVGDINHVPAGVTLTRLGVAQTAPLFINGTGNLTATAGGSIYLQATATPQGAGASMTVNNILAGGDVVLLAPQGIAVGVPGTNGVLVLDAAGLNTYASAALTPANNTLFTQLNHDGALTNGTFVLTPAGISDFRATAAAALNIAHPTDAQVQAYANIAYHILTQTIEAYANAQYQGLAQKVQNGIQLSGSVQDGTFVLTAAGIAQFAQHVLSSSDYSEYQTLIGNGVVQNGTLVLTTTGLSAEAQAALGSTGYAAYQALLSTNGALQNGRIVLNATGLSAYASNALTSTAYTTFTNLQTNGSAQTGTYTLSNAGIVLFAPSALSSSASSAFTTLLSYGTVQNGALVLTSAGVAYYAPTLLPSGSVSAFSTLIGSGSVSNGFFIIDPSKLNTYASVALGSNYSAWTTLTGYGSVSGSDLTLTDGGVAHYASAALTSSQYTSFSALLGGGSVSGGVLTLSASGVTSFASTYLSSSEYSTNFSKITNATYATISSGTVTLTSTGISYFQSAANTACNCTATSTQVTSYAQTLYSNDVSAIQSGANTSYQGYVPTIQTYGDTLYGNYAQTIRSYTNDQYQGYAQTIQTAANTTYVADVQTIQSYAQTQYQASVQTIQTYANGLYQSDVAAIGAYAQTRYTALVQQVQTGVSGAGTIQNNTFVLNSTNIAGYAPLLLSSGDLATLQALTANGAVGSQALQPVQVATPGNLTLVAGTSDIGSQATPFGYQIGGALVTASAGNNAYLNALSGDALIGQVYAGGVASIAAPDGSILSYLPGVTVKATSIELVAEDNISCAAGMCGSTSGTAPFQIQVGATGSLSGSAGGSAIFYAPTPSAPPAINLQLGSFTAPTGLTITADAGIEILAGATLSTTTGAISITGASFTMDANSAVIASSSVTVATLSGDVVLGKLQATAGTGTAQNPDIVVTSGGSIFGNGDGQVNVVGAVGSLTASTSIGTSSVAVAIGTPLLSATALNGGIYLSTPIDLHATSLSAEKGSVSITGALGLTLDNITAGTATGASGTVYARATDGTLDLGTVSSSGSQTFRASGNVSYTSLTTTGTTTDPGDISVTSDQGSITGGTVAANGSATLSAYTSNTGDTATATNGLLSLSGGGLIQWTTLSAGTTLGVSSSGGAVSLGTATSNGTQTIGAYTDVSFTQLTAKGIAATQTNPGDAGDIGVTATTGSITGGSVSAAGSATLTAQTSNTGDTATATNGALALKAGGLIQWNTLSAGTTLGATSSGGAVSLGTATSNGTQTIGADTDVSFTQLTAKGIAATQTDPGDAGDIGVSATAGSITGGSVSAAGSATLTAHTSNTGDTATATNGALTLNAGGLIQWNTLSAGTTLGATSSGGAIVLGTATSNGTQTLKAYTDLSFTQLTTYGITGTPGDPGDVDLTATTGAIKGGSINAAGSINGFGNGITFASFTAGQDISLTSTGDITGHSLVAVGDATLTAGAPPGSHGSITLDTITAATVTLNADGSLNITNINVAKQMALHATDINVGITQVPLPPLPGTPPLKLDITGPGNGVANSVDLTINAPAGVVFSTLFAKTAVIDTTALNVAIQNGFVPGQMTLLTPSQLVFLNDMSPTPTSGNNIQLWQPSFAFGLNLQGNGLTTNSFVVQYQVGSNPTDVLGGLPFDGISLIRDVERDMRVGEGFTFQGIGIGSNSALYVIGLSPEGYLEAHKLLSSIKKPVAGPAVNLGGH